MFAKLARFKFPFRRPLSGFRELELTPVSGLEVETVVLAEASKSTIACPHWQGALSRVTIEIAPAVKLRILTNCIVSAYSVGIVQKNLLIFPETCLRDLRRVATDDAGLFRLSNASRAATRVSEKSMLAGSLDQAFFLGGAGSFNWYHFVLECLPKAFLCQTLFPRYSNIPLLVPFECKQIPQFAEILEKVSSGRRLIYLQRGEYMMVRELLVIDEVSSGPFNLVAGEWPKVTDYYQHDSIMRDFSSALKAVFLSQESRAKQGRRLFLARPGIRRKYNQDELIEIANGFGFEKFQPEQFSLMQQARVFSEASAIVGPSGAAWVGLLFCEQPIKALSWLPKEYSEFCSYSTLAQNLGHELNFIESYYDSVLKSTGDAYVGSYKVSPGHFKDALMNICEAL